MPRLILPRLPAAGAVGMQEGKEARVAVAAHNTQAPGGGSRGAEGRQIRRVRPRRPRPGREPPPIPWPSRRKQHTSGALKVKVQVGVLVVCHPQRGRRGGVPASARRSEATAGSRAAGRPRPRRASSRLPHLQPSHALEPPNPPARAVGQGGRRGAWSATVLPSGTENGATRCGTTTSASTATSTILPAVIVPQAFLLLPGRTTPGPRGLRACARLSFTRARGPMLKRTWRSAG